MPTGTWTVAPASRPAGTTNLTKLPGRRDRERLPGHRARRDRDADVRRGRPRIRHARPQYEVARHGDGEPGGERVDDEDPPQTRPPLNLRHCDRHVHGPDHDEQDVQERGRGRRDLALAVGLGGKRRYRQRTPRLMPARR